MKEIIKNGLSELNLLDKVPENAPELLERYGRMLIEKNEVMNLTAITDPDQVAKLHMLDCAALVNCADFHGKTLIDVGTGAGFPGIPLKILVPDLEITLLDSLNKRVNWLNEVIEALGLTGIRAIHARAEEQALVKGFRDSFDLVTARAVADLRLLTIEKVAPTLKGFCCSFHPRPQPPGQVSCYRSKPGPPYFKIDDINSVF